MQLSWLTSSTFRHSKYLFQNLWRVSKPTSNKQATNRWSIFSCRVASWLIQVLAKSNESWTSTKYWNIFFSSKSDQYRVWQVLRLMSTDKWLQTFSYNLSSLALNSLLAKLNNWGCWTKVQHPGDIHHKQYQKTRVKSVEVCTCIHTHIHFFLLTLGD